MTLLLFVTGLAVVLLGGELLVRGSVRLALTSGVRPLVIGLTVIAFGTSAPEVMIAVHGSLSNQTDIALGNVVGSNIFNVLFILGITAAMRPLIVSRQIIRLDVPIMIAVSFLLGMVALDHRIGRYEGAAFLIMLAGYIVIQVMLSRQDEPTEDEGVDEPPKPKGVTKSILMVVTGLVALVFGADWLVDAAAGIARTLGVTELVIGLTIVTVGTSTPEVVTSIIAARRGEPDLVVGNIVGTSLFNILGVLGIGGIISSTGIPISNALLTLDIPVLIAVAVLCLPIFFSGYSINRWEALLFLVYYGLYFTYLVLDAARHEGRAEYGRVVLTVVVPLTLVTLVGFTAHTWWRRRTARPVQHVTDAAGNSGP